MMIDIITAKLDISDVSSDDDDFDEDQDWDNMELPLREKMVPPLFCRGCLSPYFGEKRHDGSHVLTCTKCKKTRELSHEDFRDVPPEEKDSYIGDVVSNRFRPLIEEQRRLKEMNVSDPDFMEDEFKKYYHVYTYILKLMTQTVSSMHKILDNHRHRYNESIIKKLAVDAASFDDITITVTGSKVTNDLLINPDDYTVPAEVCAQCNVQGKKGVRSADKYILEANILMKLVEEMPLFQQRLFHYRTRAQFALMRTLNEKTKLDNQSVSGKKLRKNRKKLKNTNKEEENTWGVKEFVNCTNSPIYKMSEVFGDKFKSDPMDESSDEETEENDDSECEDDVEQIEQEAQETAVVKYDGVRQKIDHKNSPEKLQLRAMIKRCERDLEKYTTAEQEEEIRFQTEVNFLLPYIMRDAESEIDHEKFDVRHVSKAFREIMKALKKRSDIEQRHRKVITLKELEKAVMDMTDHVDEIKGEIIRDLQEAYRVKMITAHRDKKEAEETHNNLVLYKSLLEKYQSTNEFHKADEILKKVNISRDRLFQLKEKHSKK